MPTQPTINAVERKITKLPGPLRMRRPLRMAAYSVWRRIAPVITGRGKASSVSCSSRTYRCCSTNLFPSSVTMTMRPLRARNPLSMASSQIANRGHDVRHASMTSSYVRGLHETNSIRSATNAWLSIAGSERTESAGRRVYSLASHRSIISSRGVRLHRYRLSETDFRHPQCNEATRRRTEATEPHPKPRYVAGAIRQGLCQQTPS